MRRREDEDEERDREDRENRRARLQDDEDVRSTHSDRQDARSMLSFAQAQGCVWGIPDLANELACLTLSTASTSGHF